MNKRQIDFAARLYALAMVAHCDAGEDDEHAAVAARAAECAREKLLSMGYQVSDLTTAARCIAVAKCKTPNVGAKAGRTAQEKA